MHGLAGLPSPTRAPTVLLALEGYKRATASPVIRKSPISPDTLKKIYAAHGHADASLNDLRILFISFIAYAGFLRFDDLKGITRSDCVLSAECLSISLKKARMTNFGKESKCL